MELSGAAESEPKTANYFGSGSSKIVRLREAPAPKNFYFSLMTMDIWTQQPSPPKKHTDKQPLEYICEAFVRKLDPRPLGVSSLKNLFIGQENL